MSKTFCEICNELVEYKIRKRIKEEMINNKIVSFNELYAICKKCNNEVYVEKLYDQNMLEYSEKVKEINGIITIREIEEILNKYAIGKKPLSLVLGWGEVTIIRYLEGSTPEKAYSDILKKVLEDPNTLYEYLEKNKDLITKVAYKKTLGKIMELKLTEDQSKIYLISKHIIAKMEDITPLALQKILYYIQGFSTYFFDNPIFNDNAEAWVHGPVYREIYDRFSYYRYNPISKNEFESYNEIDSLSEKEIKLIDSVINNFGVYSGKTLEKMTHITIPWEEGRKELSEEEYSSNIIDTDTMKDYFTNIGKKYKMKDISDISKYASSIFKEIMDGDNK